MRNVLVLLAAALLACLSLPVVATESHVALVRGVTGQVTVVRGADTQEVEVGTQLQVADRVVTAPDATASIVFLDGTMLTLGGSADAHVRDYVFEPKAERYAFSLYISQGSAIYESGKIGRVAPEAVEVETPQATVGVRGTRFLIEAGGP
uniref:FecR domain-containing protein n=1 Tax=Coralloluteibacterium stylophorae TaxID=1776034 RepID=A0A8J7VRL7_9GAMM